MRCPRCNKENPASGVFCIFCGAPIGGRISEEEGSAALEEQVRSLGKEVHQVRQALLRIEDRLSTLERLQPLPPTVARAPVEALPIMESVPVEALPTTEPARVEIPPTVSPAPAVSRRKPALDWEQVLPGNWMARIGVVALVIGIAFFLKLAFENDWIGVTGRVILGLVGGIALLGAGEYWQKRYPVWAQTLTGGGIAILYLSILAAFALYHLISFFPAFGFIFLVNATAVGLALRHEAVAIAILGIIGAFATPVILSVVEPAGGGQDTPSALVLPYVLLLDVGVLGLATFRNWRWFTLLGLLCSLSFFGLWYSQSGAQAGLLVAEGALTFIFLIFVGATTLFHILWRRLPEPADLGLMMLNAAAYFGISYRLLWVDFRFLLGGFSLLLALFYGLLGYAVLAKSRENARLCFFAVGIALVFLTVAIPVQLGGAWIAVAWAAEGAVLMWLSFVLDMHLLRQFSLGVFVIMVIRLTYFDTPVELLPFRPVINERFLAFTAGILAMYLAAYFLWRGRTAIRQGERWLFPAFLVAANFFSLLVLSAEVISYIDDENVRSLSLTLLWAAYALVLIAVGVVKRWRWVRLGGLALLWVPVGKALVYDVATLGAGYRVAVFTADVFALYLAAYFLWRGRTVIRQEERWYFPAFLVAANFFSLLTLSDVVISYIDDENVRSLSLTLLWAAYALVLIVLGIIKRWRWVRLGGLALLCLAIGKVFVFDVVTLERGYRVAAFLALGAILIAGGFLYQRYSRVIKRFLLE